jgi:hypothetical protein
LDARIRAATGQVEAHDPAPSDLAPKKRPLETVQASGSHNGEVADPRKENARFNIGSWHEGISTKHEGFSSWHEWRPTLRVPPPGLRRTGCRRTRSGGCADTRPRHSRRPRQPGTHSSRRPHRAIPIATTLYYIYTTNRLASHRSKATGTRGRCGVDPNAAGARHPTRTSLLDPRCNSARPRLCARHGTMGSRPRATGYLPKTSDPRPWPADPHRQGNHRTPIRDNRCPTDRRSPHRRPSSRPQRHRNHAPTRHPVRPPDHPHHHANQR